MRVAFTFEEEALSHFLFTTMGRRALLSAAGALAVVGAYCLYQRYQAQPEQKPEAATAPQVAEPNQDPHAEDNDASTRTMARLKPSFTNTDPAIQEPVSPKDESKTNDFSQRRSASSPLSEFFRVDHPLKEAAGLSAHSKQDPADPNAVLVEHGSGDDVTQAFRR